MTKKYFQYHQFLNVDHILRLPENQIQNRERRNDDGFTNSSEMIVAAITELLPLSKVMC